MVGLTGGIGSGKTTVANLFAAHGVCLVDADVIARDVVAVGSDGLAAISHHFGAEVLLADGSLNRPWLRQTIFADAVAKAWLNALLHPLIRQEILQQLAHAQSDYVLLVAPLLIENGLTALTDQVLVVDVLPETQIRRTAMRDGVPDTQVAAILAAQCSREQRLAAASQIINNDVDQIDLTEQVTRLHEFYLQLAREKLAKSPS